MQRRRVYSTRCMISHPPGYRTEEPEFYRCKICGTVQVRLRPAGVPLPVHEDAGTCCETTIEKLLPCKEEKVCGEHVIKFCVFGGFEHNTIRVEVAGGYHPMSEEHRIEWIYLRTFQGGQMKYLGFKGEAATLFSMANEDAFAFCGREICYMGWEHCLFQCKRGHAAYAYCSGHGLFQYQF